MFGAIAAAAPGILSSIGSIAGMFGKKKKPSSEANKYLDQIPGAMNPYYQPYIDKGRESYNSVNNEYGKMVDDPSSLYSKLSGGFQSSPGYQFKLNEALGAGNNASAAGGMLGTPQHQEQNMQTAHGIADQDFENYMKNILGLYAGGIAGQQGTANQGFDAGKDYAAILGDILGQKGKMAYEDANASNTRMGQSLSGLAGGIGQGISGYNSYNQQQQLMNWLNGKGGF